MAAATALAAGSAAGMVAWVSHLLSHLDGYVTWLVAALHCVNCGCATCSQESSSGAYGHVASLDANLWLGPVGRDHGEEGLKRWAARKYSRQLNCALSLASQVNS